MQDTIIEALRRNAVDEALTAAREWAFQQPDDPQAHRWLAQAWQQNGDHAAAMNSIDRALALAPEDAGLHVARANLLIGARQLEEAQAALVQASGLDPNQFGAYLLQAQLAFGRGDLDEAERYNRLAARVLPEHPLLAVIQALVALQRGQAEQALRIAVAALQRAPDSVQLRHVAGFAYMANGHHAFAEQAFRGVLAELPDTRNLRVLLSQLAARQQRPADAADELTPLLEDPATATPALLRLAGRLRMAAGQIEEALPLLRSALAGLPGDRPTLQALVDAWQRLGRSEEAHGALEAALATTADSADLWRARLAVEADPVARRGVIERWIAAMPQATLPLEVLMLQQQEAGDRAGADATAQRILALAAEHTVARMQVLDSLMQQDPAAAVAQIEQWLLTTQGAPERRFLLGMLGLSHDGAGRPAAAVEAWSRMQAELAPTLAPLPPQSAPRSDWPELALRPENAPQIAFLWGAPGSAVERLAAVAQAAGDPFRGDRFGATPPQDGFQSYALVEGLSAGTIDPAQLVARWRATLPRRGLGGGHCFDWLPWWDNALLVALRPHLREAMLVIAVRDPRDMLLEWLAFGAVQPFAFPSPEQAAEWLAAALNQIAALHEQQWFPNRVVRTDAIGHDPEAATLQLNQALGTLVPAPATVGPPRFPAGHWREYAQALAGPFATLAPVATRLGYPAG